MGRASRKQTGQTATEYMLIISVVVIAVVAAAYQFVPLFQEGVEDLGQDVKQMLANGDVGRGGGGGSGMGSGSTARVASRPCDGSAEALRYESMFDPPPCAKPAPEPWTPSPDPAAPLAPDTHLLGADMLVLTAATSGGAPADPEETGAPVRIDDPVVYLSSARLGRRSRSRVR